MGTADARGSSAAARHAAGSGLRVAKVLSMLFKGLCLDQRDDAENRPAKPFETSGPENE